MQMITREADSTKQESSRSTDNTAHTFTTSSWSRLKDPRIVRVSRAFGGKDRHSKVCTVRGLRDRRVRLSAPTAIQLYDLQDRLGLNQPSKVVDWLLNAAKHEIDELPPLQFPQHTLLPPPINSHQIRPPADKQGLSEDVASPEDQRESWARSNQDISYHFSTQNFSSISPINSFVRWDPSNLTLSNTAGSDWHNLSQVYQQPSGLMSAQHQPYFHSQISASNAELFDSKNLNFQSSQLSNSSLTTSPTVDQSSSTLPVRPAHFNMTDLLPSQNNDGS